MVEFHMNADQQIRAQALRLIDENTNWTTHINRLEIAQSLAEFISTGQIKGVEDDD